MQLTPRAVEAIRYTIGDQEGLLLPGYDWDKEGNIRYFAKPKTASYRMRASTGEGKDDILLPNGTFLLENDWRVRLQPKMYKHRQAVSDSLHTGETRAALHLLRSELASVIREACGAPDSRVMLVHRDPVFGGSTSRLAAW